MIEHDELAILRLEAGRIVDDGADVAPVRLVVITGPRVGPGRPLGFDDDRAEQAAREKVRLLGPVALSMAWFAPS